MVGRWVGGVGGETNSGRRGEGTGGGRGQEGEGTEEGDSCRKGGGGVSDGAVTRRTRSEFH